MSSITGQIEKAHYILRRAGAALAGGEPSAEARWALGEIYLLQSLLNMNLGMTNFITLLQKADKLLPKGSSLITRHTGLCLGNNNAMIYPGYKKQDVHRILDAMYEADPYVLNLTHGFGYGRQYLASTEVYYYTDQFRKAKSSAQRGISRAGEYEQWDLQCNAHCLLMRIAIAQGDYRPAVLHIKKMKECRLRYGEKEQRILVLPDLAVRQLRLAYDMSASNDLIMMFAEYGKHMAVLMEWARQAAGHHDIPPVWIDRVQQRAETYSRNLGRLRTTYLAMETGDTTPGPLTRRELEAMELLCEGLSNQQIADRMSIQVTSLKSHLQRIYGKIGAENRADAVRIWLSLKR